MPERRDETPTDPETAARWRDLATRARRRSTKVQTLATTLAMQISAIDGIDIQVHALELLTQRIRGGLNDAIDLAHGALSTELVTVAAERDALTARLEESAAELHRVRDRVTSLERAQELDGRRLGVLEEERAALKARRIVSQQVASDDDPQRERHGI